MAAPPRRNIVLSIVLSADGGALGSVEAPLSGALLALSVAELPLSTGLGGVLLATCLGPLALVRILVLALGPAALGPAPGPRGRLDAFLPRADARAMLAGRAFAGGCEGWRLPEGLLPPFPRGDSEGARAPPGAKSLADG